MNYNEAEFERKVNQAYRDGAPLIDGYAPFCKHVFIPNFIPDLRCGYTKISDENKYLIESCYEARLVHRTMLTLLHATSQHLRIEIIT